MLELVNSDKALLEKKEREIAMLKDLLQHERRINSYLSSPQQKSKPQSTQSRKFRARFIPIDISITNTEPSSTFLKPSDLMEPFDPRPFDLALKSTQALSLSVQSTPNRRRSTASSLYFSASDETMHELLPMDLSTVQEATSIHSSRKDSELELHSSDNTYAISAESLGFQRKGSSSTMASDLQDFSFINKY